jgi:GNAT superfamily N-acetyltransferase
MSRSDRIFCFEALSVRDPLVRAAERLYEQTQHPDERIPWGWIARSVKGRSCWRPGSWGKHLLVATPADRPTDPGALAGFAYGAHLPGYGGYLCYVGVDEKFRKRGVGTRLYHQMFRVLAADACAVDEPLPFVVWESHKPGPDAPEADWKLWEARVRLFDKVGGLWIDGLELMTPNCAVEDGPPVPLQLFVKPVDTPAAAFDAARLKQVAAGLLERVYKARPGDPLYDATLPPGCEPRLRPAAEAGRRKEKALAAV